MRDSLRVVEPEWNRIGVSEVFEDGNELNFM
jgi:hypothetical protein